MLRAQTCGIFESLLHLGRTLLQHNERTGQTMPAAAHKGFFHGLMGSRGVLKQFRSVPLKHTVWQLRHEEKHWHNLTVPMSTIS